MRGFRTRTSVDEFLNLIKQCCSANAGEVVDVIDCPGSVLAEDIVSPVNIPGFDRSAMDGFALKGEETFGADTYNPLSFTVIGEVTPGRTFQGEIGKGQAVRIMTGAPLPKGANAVLMAEYTEQKGDQVEALQAVAPGKNVSKIGEDIRVNEILFGKNRKLRIQDAAVMASTGIGNIKVIAKPAVDVLITGNEILQPGQKPEGVKIVDSNSVLLRHLIRRDGGLVRNIHYLPDKRDLIRQAIQDSTADIVCLSGGASVGVEDFASALVAELGELLVHGVAMRPASPTGFGTIGRKKIFLLPGNPVSALAAYDFFVRIAIRIMGGQSLEWPYRQKSVTLATKIPSQIGRVDYVRVQIANDRASLLSTSGASILSSTSRADGFLVTGEESEGLAEGESVNVWLYDI
jgi:molybdopterin molybdotransferase